MTTLLERVESLERRIGSNIRWTCVIVMMVVQIITTLASLHTQRGLLRRIEQVERQGCVVEPPLLVAHIQE